MQGLQNTDLDSLTEREEMPLALPVALASRLKKLFMGCPSGADREKDFRRSHSLTIPSLAPDVASTYSSTNATDVTLCWDANRRAAAPETQLRLVSFHVCVPHFKCRSHFYTSENLAPACVCASCFHAPCFLVVILHLLFVLHVQRA
jgi:hypothetical protein